jgi:hypothetical protein
MARIRRLGLAALTVLLGYALSGCVGIDATNSAQPASSGPINLSIHACANGAPGCNGASNNGSVYGFLDAANSDDPVPVQLIVSVRLPEGSTPPNTLSGAIDGGAGALTFTRSASLEADLQALEPAPSGERWWGWLSNQVNYGRKTKQGFGVSIQTTLPATADGSPYPTPFKWSATVGGRFVDTASGKPASRPVDCGSTNDDLYKGWGEGTSGTTIVCIDSPSPAAARGYLNAPIVDFGLSGTNVQTSPGGTVTATFLAKRSGVPDTSTTYSLAASGGAPGGTIMLDRSTAPLGGDSTIPVLATVMVPAATAPGTYPVTLTATAPGKPTKSVTSNVVVAAPSSPGDGGGGGGAGGGGGGSADTQKPTVRSVSLSRKKFKVKTKATQLRVDTDEMGTLEIVFDQLVKKHKKRLKGTLIKSLPAGISRIDFNGKVASKKLKPGRYQLTLTVTDSSGNKSAPKTLKFTVTK